MRAEISPTYPACHAKGYFGSFLDFALTYFCPSCDKSCCRNSQPAGETTSYYRSNRRCIGTSLPELAANVTAAVKGHAEIAIGNVIGSNILIFSLFLRSRLMHPSQSIRSFYGETTA
ncbi:MAG: hypothetical protein Ct9H300mP8_08240 [Gammaproteobacteria bacterium]|nr:MAG: hypothetical protein Ct9H300mP8_08240 [Gammaproteobacteria bacterium]